MSRLIDIENDQSQQVIDAATKALNEKGVILDGTENYEDGVWARALGKGNGRSVKFNIPKQKDLSNEQIQEKASEIVREVEQKMRGGGDEL